MDVLSAFGVISGFIGSLLLSIGLIRSKEEIKDFESTYWNENPYKVNAALEENKYILWGIRLLFVNFSTELGVILSKYISGLQLVNSIFIALLGTLIGILLIEIYSDKRLASHRKLKSRLLEKQFWQNVKNLQRQAYSHPEQYNNSSQILGVFKQQGVSRLNQILEDIENEELIQKFQIFRDDLEVQTNFEDAKKIIDDFLKVNTDNM